MTPLRLNIDRPPEAPPSQLPEALVSIARQDSERVRTGRSFVIQTWMPPVHGAFTINAVQSQVASRTSGPLGPLTFTTAPLVGLTATWPSRRG